MSGTLWQSKKCSQNNFDVYFKMVFQRENKKSKFIYMFINNLINIS